MKTTQNIVSRPDVTVENGRLSFLLNGKTGWRNLQPRVVTNKGDEGIAQEECAATPGGLRFTGRYPLSGLTESIELAHSGADGLAITRTLTNPGISAVLVRDLLLSAPPEGGGPVFGDNSSWRLRFAHLDNLRAERFPVCRPDYPYVRPVPLVPTWFGDMENQAAPYVLLGNESCTEMLVQGQLKQESTRMRWRLGAASGGAFLFADHTISWSVVNGGGITVQPGRSVTFEPLFWQIARNTHWQNALEGYFKEVVARNELRQTDNILHSRAFYCSWNYGIAQNISEESLLKTARAIRKELPGIKHFLIDGGWQKHEANGTPDCSNFYLPPDKQFHPERFPNGMKAMADKLRAVGLSPALWWTPAVNHSGKLAAENPHWLAKDPSGAPYRIGGFGYLDYSLPAVQDYLHGIFRTIFKEWGYEGLKMDFWSQSVEAETIRYATGNGIQWRDWLLSTIRGYLPADGFLMTCVATAMGNPFLGKHAHSYRVCIDVGECAHWTEHVYACCWVQGVLAFPGRQIGLMNADGFGVSPHFSDAENLHRLTYGFITMGSLEIDGRLEELSPRHIGWLRRMTSHVDRGYAVKTADDQAFTGEPYPAVLFVEYPPDSPTFRRGVRLHVALFNWSAEARRVGTTMAQLGLRGPVTARDFWTDAQATFGADGIHETIEGHGARLYEIAQSP